MNRVVVVLRAVSHPENPAKLLRLKSVVLAWGTDESVELRRSGLPLLRESLLLVYGVGSDRLEGCSTACSLGPRPSRLRLDVLFVLAFDQLLKQLIVPVSYTHLTLPTICSV